LKDLSKEEIASLKNKVTDNINFKFDLLAPLTSSVVCLKSENFKKFHDNHVSVTRKEEEVSYIKPKLGTHRSIETNRPPQKQQSSKMEAF
jgi:hypothetical protein